MGSYFREDNLMQQIKYKFHRSNNSNSPFNYIKYSPQSIPNNSGTKILLLCPFLSHLFGQQLTNEFKIKYNIIRMKKWKHNLTIKTGEEYSNGNHGGKKFSSISH